MIRAIEHLLALALLAGSALFVALGYQGGGWPYAVANGLMLIGLYLFFSLTKRL